MRTLILAVMALAAIGVRADEEYRLPSDVVSRILTAPPLPDASVSPDRNWVLLTQHEARPDIALLMKPRRFLASYGIDLETGSLAPDERYGTGLTLRSTTSPDEWAVWNSKGRITAPLWSPDSRRFVFGVKMDPGLQLWIGDRAAKTVRQLTASALSQAQRSSVPCVWMSDSARILCQFLPEGRGAPPAAEPSIPAPAIAESSGRESSATPIRLALPGKNDDELLEYYVSSQLGIVDIRTGQMQGIPATGIHEYVSPSPDGRYVLTSRIVRPYAFTESVTLFPRQIDVIDLKTSEVRTLATRSLGKWRFERGRAPTGSRRFSWLPTVPATLMYVEAVDGGNLEGAQSYRDRLLVLPAPFKDAPVEVMRAKGRLATVAESLRYVADIRIQNLLWLADGSAWAEELDYAARRKRIWRVPTQGNDAVPSLLLEYSLENRAEAPVLPLLVGGTENGNPILLQDGDWIYLTGEATADGNASPFLDKFNVRTQARQRLFTSSTGRYDEVLQVLDAHRLLLKVESPTEPPNYRVVSSQGRTSLALTALQMPAPELKNIRPQLITYARPDGVRLSGTLYLPADYKKGERLPTLIWAYPSSVQTAAAASSRITSPSRYLWSGNDRLAVNACALLTAGYAVLWDAAMPVIGGNDTAVPQLVANAQAAVDALVEMGVSDRTRMAVAGHSYGGAMTATLLAHSDLFAAGIAISGAYNFTHVPRSFQTEMRTLWEAPNAYLELSALFHADRIEAPLLLIHGVQDDNVAARPSESERMYTALSGLGRKTRLVMLPFEGHVPIARQSVGHVAWEMRDWLDRHLRPTPAESNANVSKDDSSFGGSTRVEAAQRYTR